MTKAELAKGIANKTGSTLSMASAMVDALLSTVVDALRKGEKVTLTGFGTFSLRTRNAREFVAPPGRGGGGGGKKVQKPARKVPALSFSQVLKDTLSGV